MKIWLTADLHLGHEGIIAKCGRPFESAEAMDTVLLRWINFLVAPCDRLIIAGDFTLKNSRKHIEGYRAQIKCKDVHLVRGNHDSSRDSDYRTFQSVSDHMEFKLNKTRIVINHYPMEAWRGQGGNGIHLHGHCHGNRELRPGCLDVGVDPHGGQPINLELAILRVKQCDKREPRWKAAAT